MLISTERGSAQIVSSGEDTRFYDDVGCLAADWAAHSNRAHAFVRVGNGWVDASTAAFVRSTDARTAMGSGVVAFASAADAHAAGDAAIMTFEAIVHRPGARR
jgi:hypothetical protein